MSLLKKKPEYDLMVNQLIENFKPERGKKIAYQKVELILSSKKGDKVYNRVTEKWRKKVLNDFGIKICCITGVAFEMMDAEDQVYKTYVERGVKIKNQFKKTIREIGAVDPGELKPHAQAFQLNETQEATNELKKLRNTQRAKIALFGGE